MGEYTGIEWTDRTWNPVTGCTKVSPGCDHCYAEAIARRFAGSRAFPEGFAVTLHPGRLGAPLRWRAPCRVFVNSMSDLFHPRVPAEFITDIFQVMAATPRHTYQVLTKRPARMRALLAHDGAVGGVLERRGALGTPGRASWVGWPLPNVHLGVSAEDQQRAHLRIPALLDTPAVVHFVFAEPLLGPVVLHRGWLTTRGGGARIGWVIAGGESGRSARPMSPDWARSLRDQCQAAGVAFFFKQWGEWAPVSGRAGSADPDARMVRAGKKTAGRLLDGRCWDEFPPGVAS